jgi:hypothetical protein
MQNAINALMLDIGVLLIAANLAALSHVSTTHDHIPTAIIYEPVISDLPTLTNFSFFIILCSAIATVTPFPRPLKC